MENSNSQSNPSSTSSVAAIFVLPFFIGGTYYASVAVNHISTHPHQMLDFVIAVPFAYITLGTVCGIFCLVTWSLAEGFCNAIGEWIIPKNDSQKVNDLRSYQP